MIKKLEKVKILYVIDSENGNEIFIIEDDKINNQESISIKDVKTGKDILVNKEHGEIIHY